LRQDRPTLAGLAPEPCEQARNRSQRPVALRDHLAGHVGGPAAFAAHFEPPAGGGHRLGAGVDRLPRPLLGLGPVGPQPPAQRVQVPFARLRVPPDHGRGLRGRHLPRRREVGQRAGGAEQLPHRVGGHGLDVAAAHAGEDTVAAGKLDSPPLTVAVQAGVRGPTYSCTTAVPPTGRSARRPFVARCSWRVPSNLTSEQR